MTGKSICIGRRLSSHHITGSLGAWIDEVFSHDCLFRVIVQAVLAFAKRWVYDGQEKFSLRRIFPPFFLNGGASGLDSDWFLGVCGKWGLTFQNYLELDFNTSIGAAKPKIYTSIRYNTLKAAY